MNFLLKLVHFIHLVILRFLKAGRDSTTTLTLLYFLFSLLNILRVVSYLYRLPKTTLSNLILIVSRGVFQAIKANLEREVIEILSLFA